MIEELTKRGANEFTYHGNSVSYIYGKMCCYREQLFTMVQALRLLGIEYNECGRDNIERRKEVLQRASVLAELEAENARLQNNNKSLAGKLKSQATLSRRLEMEVFALKVERQGKDAELEDVRENGTSCKNCKWDKDDKCLEWESDLCEWEWVGKKLGV